VTKTPTPAAGGAPPHRDRPASPAQELALLPQFLKMSWLLSHHKGISHHKEMPWWLLWLLLWLLLFWLFSHHKEISHHKTWTISHHKTWIISHHKTWIISHHKT